MTKQTYNFITIRDMVLISLCTALIIIGSFIKINFMIVPFTLQTLFIILTSLLLGSRRGFLSVLLFVLLGLMGVPVFSMGSGVSYMLTPTFGYILGFLVCPFVTDLVLKIYKKGPFRLLIASIAGLSTIYFFGYFYWVLLSVLYFAKEVDMAKLFYSFVLVFVPKDIVCCMIASFAAERIKKAIPNL